MKILLTYFNSESNEHSRSLMTFDRSVFKFGEETVQYVSCRKIFENVGIELIPAIVARGHSYGPITHDAFELIRSRMTAEVKSCVHEIDGIFLFLYGTSKVVGLARGLAEHAFLREIREMTGPCMPVTLVMDPHGNLFEELVNKMNTLHCHRHSPHTDAEETFQFVAEKFVELLRNRRNIKPVYRKVPITIGGEKSVSLNEPMVSIDRLYDEAEKDGRIVSVSFHIGYLRHDGDKLGCSVVVVSQSGEYRAYAEEVTDHIYVFVYPRRHEFHYYGNTGEPQEVLKKVVAHTGGTVFITDSGGNVGLRGDGLNAYMLRQIFALHGTSHKQYLVSGTADYNAFKKLYPRHVSEHINLHIGINYDELYRSIPIEETMIAKGISDKGYEHKKDMGTTIAARLDHTPVSVIILSDATQSYESEQYTRRGVVLKECDVVVVKQGYVSAEFAAYDDLCMMTLTQRPIYQRNEPLKFKQIYRPTWPYDDYDLEGML